MLRLSGIDFNLYWDEEKTRNNGNSPPNFPSSTVKATKLSVMTIAYRFSLRVIYCIISLQAKYSINCILQKYVLRFVTKGYCCQQLCQFHDKLFSFLIIHIQIIFSFIKKTFSKLFKQHILRSYYLKVLPYRTLPAQQCPTVPVPSWLKPKRNGLWDSSEGLID